MAKKSFVVGECNNPVGFIDIDFMGFGRDVTETCGRLYYPAGPSTPTDLPWLFRWPWVPEGGHEAYSRGAAHFLFFMQPSDSILIKSLKWATQNVFYLCGKMGTLEATEGAVPAHGTFPLVVFSHGIGGTRTMYSMLCQRLAKAGYAVLAMEHTDGTALCCSLPGGKGFMFYQGLGGVFGMNSKIVHRVQEIDLAIDAMRGLTGPGLATSASYTASRIIVRGPMENQAAFEALRARIDPTSPAIVGHSFGGATSASATACIPGTSCGVSLDPYWPCLPDSDAVFHGWKTSAPLMVVGSEVWNTPNENGLIFCGGERQRQIFECGAISPPSTARSIVLQAAAGPRRDVESGRLRRVSTHKIQSRLIMDSEVAEVAMEAAGKVTATPRGGVRTGKPGNARQVFDPSASPRAQKPPTFKPPSVSVAAAAGAAGAAPSADEECVEASDSSMSPRTAAVAAVAAAVGSTDDGKPRGPGIFFFVPKGSTHHSFDDALPRFGELLPVKLLLRALGFPKSGLEPHKSVHVMGSAVLTFLNSCSVKPRFAFETVGSGSTKMGRSRMSTGISRKENPQQWLQSTFNALKSVFEPNGVQLREALAV